ncbi:MAG: glutamate--tRNA ligase [bacterium]|jgi:nondiscriminating glutamyl-tRNA synthetase
MKNLVRVRMAPSPTGPVHVGNIRTALFNWLYARNQGGSFILRFEDTDISRSRPEYEQIIIDEFKWLGLNWDEGPDCGGSYGPYRQTEKIATYQGSAQKLLDSGWAYRCYCTMEELEKEREAAFAGGEVPRYSGHCRDLTPEQEKQYIREGRRPALRFRVPPGEKIVFNDLIRGRVEFDSDLLGDFVIVRPDGIPIYNFAVVIDDADMKITHVIRAEEHVSNTPRQILIYRALGLDLPKFAHVSMVLGPDRTKLSKRHGKAYVGQYREAGYLPEAMLNFLALIGWSPEGEQEIMSVAEITRQFTLDRIAHNPGIFDIDKLNWMNGHYIQQSSDARITDLAIPHLQKAGLIGEKISPTERAWLEKVVGLVKEYLSYVGQITEHAGIFFLDEVVPENEAAAEVLQGEHVPLVLRAFMQRIAELPELTPDSVQALLKGLTKELGLGGKKVYMPLRVALTGQQHGPELNQVIPLLGREKIMNRLGATVAEHLDNKPAQH